MRQILLFGSRARGDAQDDSDYDMLVVADHRTQALRAVILEVESQLMERYGALVATVLRSAGLGKGGLESWGGRREPSRSAKGHHQQRPLEEMFRLCLLACEQYQYHLVHQQMVAEGLLEELPPLRALDAQDEGEDDDFEPEVIPGKPLSEIMLEDRR